MEIGKLLQLERKGSAGVSRIFALELAYIMEHFGDDSEEEARLILDLYLKGCLNLMLAVSYAQRALRHSSMLWETLIDYCLSEKKAESASIKTASPTPKKASRSGADGSLFGSLLEAAALSGADLAHLVKQIPPGMAIEGLRPRLVSAVADYRLKVQIRQTTSDIATQERIALLRELEHRSRRGTRYDNSLVQKNKDVTSMATTTLHTTKPYPGAAAKVPNENSNAPQVERADARSLQQTIKRHDRLKLSISIPIR
jgi:hypothetical protein